MKSIKPGRGPSMMGGIGSIGAGVFGIIWTIGAVSMGAPGFFAFFGVIFIIIAIVQAVYHLKNATGENRMSVFDITENEPDPLNMRYQRSNQSSSVDNEHEPAKFNRDINFCPNCGENVEQPSIKFCPGCGASVR